MGKSSFFVRFVFCAALLALIISTIGIGTVDARDPDTEPETLFRQVLSNSSSQEPVFGPERGDLGFEAHDECSECTWAAGVNLTDVHVHFDLEWPDNPALPVLLVTAVRQDDLQALDLIDPNLVTLTPDYWIHGGIAANFAQRPSSVDIIAFGNRGYFGVDGVLITTFDLSTHSGPGDIVLSAAAIAAIDGASLGITNFSVWDLQTGDSGRVMETSPQLVAAPVPGSSGMDPSRLAGGGTAVGAVVQPVRSLLAPSTLAAVAGVSGVTGQSYTSPTFGYQLAWDATWTINDEYSTGDTDYLSITNGPVTAVLTQTALAGRQASDCFSEVLETWRSDPAYSNVGYVTDEIGLPLLTPGDQVASALLAFTVTQPGGPGVDLWDYTMCGVMPEKGVMVRLDQFISPGDFMHQQTVMENLQANLWLNDIKPVSLPGLPDLSGIVAQPSEVDISNFGQLHSTTVNTAPIAAAEMVNLTLDQSARGSWFAGVTNTDVWIRVDLAEPPSGESSPWQLQIAYRAAGFGSDAVVLNSDGSWDAGQVRGTLQRVPTTIDLLAIGETGYLAFDGTLVAMLNLSTWMQPGDVIVSAAPINTVVPGTALNISAVSVWDMSPDDIAPAGAQEISAVDGDAQVFMNHIAQTGATGTSIYGPASGVMNYVPGEVTFQRTELAVSDFAARIVCLNPEVGAKWDCGFAFGDLDTVDHYRVGVISDGSWFASTGSNTPHLTGPAPAISGGMPETVTVDLVVQGGVAYLGVNSQYVATIDVTAFSGPHNIAAATAFFEDTFVEGGLILYEEFQVWSLTGQVPVAGQSVPVSDQMTGTSENVYRSPNFGFGLTWSDAWTEVDHGTVEGSDYLVLTSNGLLWADLYSVAPYVDATACNAALFDYYLTEPGYSNVAYLVDSSGNPLVEAGTDIATAWVSFSYTDSQGVTYQSYEFDVCATMPDGSTMFRLEIEGSPEDVEANLALVEELAMGIDFGLLSNPILDQKSG